METYCHKHSIKPDDEKWKVIFEELTARGEDGLGGEPFNGQVCPACYLHLKDRLADAKRNLKVESREAIHLRADNDYLQKILDAVILTVKQLTGKDAEELAGQKFQRFPGSPGVLPEQGQLENILPNLIVEAANKGKK